LGCAHPSSTSSLDSPHSVLSLRWSEVLVGVLGQFAFWGELGLCY
jgi:hypothetical protein